MLLEVRAVLSSFILTFALLVAGTAALCQEPDRPALDGYVTRVASPADFDVNGMRVLLGGVARVYAQKGNLQSTLKSDELNPYVGMRVQVYGKLRKKMNEVTATQIAVLEQAAHDVKGSGVIDAVLTPGANASSGEHLVRADGCPVLVTAQTELVFVPPLNSSSAFQWNVWLEFHGTQRPDGVVVADKATFSSNTISEGEDKLRSKKDYDPAAVDPKTKQSALSKAFLGINPKLIPPYEDPAMLARVNEIGAKLVPKYQRDLPDTDESKINFRFQLINNGKMRDSLALPSGIILVHARLWSVCRTTLNLRRCWLTTSPACLKSSNGTRNRRITRCSHPQRLEPWAESLSPDSVPRPP